MTEMQKLSALLFDGPQPISDIKFFPMERQSAPLEDIARSIRLAIIDVESGGGSGIDLTF